MADAVALIISGAGPTPVGTALNLLEAAVAMEMEAHVYFTGDAVPWIRASAAESDASHQEIADRIRTLKEDGTVGIYACTRAMATHGIPRDDLLDVVDMPSGFAYFLSLAEQASVTLNF